MRDLWTTKIRQAADTDIELLAEIERHSPHRFEFFLGVHSDEPVSARTAQAYARAGGEIYHSLTVLDGRLRFPEPKRHVVQALQGDDWRQARGALDLDFAEDAVAEEKTTFLARLADLLSEPRSFPYEETAGISSLRSHLAEFLRRYFAIPLGEESLVVLPNRESALRNLFTLYAPRRSPGATFPPPRPIRRRRSRSFCAAVSAWAPPRGLGPNHASPSAWGSLPSSPLSPRHAPENRGPFSFRPAPTANLPPPSTSLAANGASFPRGATSACRAEQLAGVLTHCGWEPLPPQGGLFLVARPAAYLGRSLRLETREGEKNYDALDSENLSEAMFWAAGLLINNSRWTGIEEHCRFVFAVAEEQFHKGLERIRAFREMVLGG